jgi:hypothetical protein
MTSTFTWKTVPVAVATCLCSAAMAALAEPPHPPPPEATAACASKQQGDKCSVQLGDRQIAGVCASDASQTLFCGPDQMPGHGPPPEAFAACSSKSAGDTCSVQLPDGSPRSGVCRTGPDARVACAPPMPPRP